MSASTDCPAALLSASEAPASLACLQLPLHGDGLLLPCVALAELINPPVLEPLAGAPHWCLGLIHWRERQLPLLSFEAAAGAAPVSARRVAVLNAQGGLPGLDCYALALQGIPRACRVDAGLSEYAPAGRLELAAVSLGGMRLGIPDLPALERELHGFWPR